MRCTQLGCKSDATWRVFWPGNHPLPTCEDHKRLAVSAGSVIGVLVHAEVIKDDPSGEGQGNSQNTQGEVY
jgi:hypothetical protein